jgi:putative Ca2+/H+ antiporter (TMEM165/GDT1 family)
MFWINLLAGLSFLAFDAWTLRGDTLDEETELKPKRFGPFLTVAVTFFIAELGDKTMLTTITIGSQQQSFIGVWLGSTLGMVVADGLAIIVGKVMGRRIPERAVKIIAAIVFFAAGLWRIAVAIRQW